MVRWHWILLPGLMLALTVRATAAPRSILHEHSRYLVAREAEDVLPSSYVIDITQTRDGYLWLGTLAGLVRFDGIRASVFDQSTTPELKSSRIVRLFEDSTGRLWIGTERAGVALAAEGSVRGVELGEDPSASQLAAVCEDQLGGVWLYTTGGQLWRYRDGRADRFKAGATEEFFSQRRMLFADERGWIWVGVDWGQFAFDPAQIAGTNVLPVVAEVRAYGWGGLDAVLPSRTGGYWRLATNHVQKWTGDQLQRDLGPYPWGMTRVSSLCEDAQGRLIVGTLGGGLFWFDSTNQATQLSTNHGLSSEFVLSLHLDNEGSLWVGTDGGGLNRIKRQVFALLEETRGWAVQSLSEEASGALWIGSIGSGLAYRTNGALTRFEGGPLKNVRSVLADREGRVWIGTLNGLFRWRGGSYESVHSIPSLQQPINALYQDRQGRLWVGTRDGLACWDGTGWRQYDRNQGLSEVRAIVEDTAGTLWIGTAGGGLHTLRDEKLSRFEQVPGLSDVSALLLDPQGTLWVGTAGLGLLRLAENVATRFTTSEGLSGNFISYLVEDAQGYLWVGSNQGLMRISKRDLNAFVPGAAQLLPLRRYGTADGLPAQECSTGSQPGVCRAQDGTLWFPTIKGLASVDPDQLKPNPVPPPVVIESVLIDGQLMGVNGIGSKPLQTITIPPNKERLEIRYSSLNLSAPDRARFRYRLEGHETDWVEVDGLSREVRYNRLPPGGYLFRVTAANEDGIWNQEGTALAVTVEPPFWRTGWFVTSASLASLGLLIGLVYVLSTQKLQRQVQRFKHQEALEKERARIARDIHDQVGASLTQVALLGELVETDKDSPEEIQTHAQQISRTARETTRALDEIVWTVNPSNDTLDGLVTYVCKYAQDYLAVAGLKYRLDVPSQLPATVIAPDVRHNVFLACKEAITNLVRHAQASAVHLRLRLNPDSFAFEIEDDGRGPSGIAGERAQTRSGLRNMRKRMEEIGGQFEIVPGAQRGTIVRLCVPLTR